MTIDLKQTTLTATPGGGVAAVGADEVKLYRAIVVRRAIDLYLKTRVQANSMYTPDAMRRVASEYTGKQYPRSRQGLEQAGRDLEVLLSAHIEKVRAAKAAEALQADADHARDRANELAALAREERDEEEQLREWDR